MPAPPPRSDTATPTELDPQRYLDLLETDGARLAEVAAPRLDAPVPACPGWTARDVLVHTGSVYRLRVANIRTLARAAEPEPTAADDPLDWFVEGHRTLIDELRARGPAAPSYTWYPPDQTVGFWYRRMAQETAVHRVDAESAAGDTGPVADDLAIDGVDEVLRRFLAHEDWADLTPEEWGGADPAAGAGRPVLLRSGAHAWQVVLGPDRVEVTPGPAGADAVVSGEPSELLLWAWGRRPVTAVQVEGDEALVDALRTRLALATL